MKFVHRGGNNYTIEGLATTDFKLKNAEGRPKKDARPGEKPRHYIIIWLDPDVADQMKELGWKVMTDEDEYNKLGIRPFINLNIKPKMGYNRWTDQDEFQPKVVMKTPSRTRLLDSVKALKNVDMSLIKNADMKIHSWVYDEAKPPAIYIDGLWFSAEDSAGTSNNIFDEQYGYEEASEAPETPDDELDDVPFK